MNWGIGNRQKSGARGTAGFVLPAVVLEVEPEFVAAARLDGSARAGRSVRHLGVRALDISTLTAHPSHSNVANADNLRQTVEDVLAAIGDVSSRVGLVVPDRVVRAGMLSFETLPDNHHEATALVRWRMRENLPFAPDEARISFQIVSRGAGHTEVFAIAARDSILGEYEAALGPSNGGPVLTLPATAALLPLLPERDSTQLLIHACSGWVTTVIVAGKQVYSWRTRELAQNAAENWPREVASESARTVASIRDRQHIEISRAWFCARPPADGDLVAELKRELGCEVEMVAPPRELAGTLSGTERSLYEHFGAPVAGLVANSARKL
jgi:hypothetical protein